MELHILFDYKSKYYKSINGGIVLGDDFNTPSIKCEKIININYDICDDNNEAASSINDIFSGLPDEMSYFRNTYYSSLFRQLSSIIYQIKNIIREEQISIIHLYGGSNFPFITLFQGEGEGNSLFFKRSWLYNYFINNYFFNSNEIHWNYKASSYKLKLFYYFRENITFFYRLSANILRNIAYSLRAEESIVIKDQNKMNILSIVNLPSQKRHIDSLFKNQNNYKLHYLSPALKKINMFDVSKYYVNTRHIRKAFQLYKKLWYSKNNKNISFKLHDQLSSLNSKWIYLSIKQNIIFFYASYYALEEYFKKNYVSKNDSVIVTNMTFGEDIVLVNKLGNDFNILHYNYQAVSMRRMIYPQFELADKYYLYSRKTYELYSSINESYKYYFPINTKLNDKYIDNNGIINSNTLTLSIFTQPDKYANQYLKILTEFLPYLASFENMKIQIKMHYRQNKIACFLKVAAKYPFVQILDKSVNASKIINESDFIMSIHSAVLFESITLGCPGIIFDLFDENRSIIYSEDICYPDINIVVKSQKDLGEIIDNPLYYKTLYYQRRDDYIAKYVSANILPTFNI